MIFLKCFPILERYLDMNFFQRYNRHGECFVGTHSFLFLEYTSFLVSIQQLGNMQFHEMRAT